jgi:hypothetical protein
VYDTDSVESIPTAIQLHDFNPGIASNGVFWTVPIPENAIDVSPGSGVARMHLTNFAVPDFGDFFSAVTGGPSVPGRATVDVRWLGGGRRTGASDATNRFEQHLVEGNAVIDWTASNANGYRYISAPGNAASKTVYAAVGHEKNGSSFRP